MFRNFLISFASIIFLMQFSIFSAYEYEGKKDKFPIPQKPVVPKETPKRKKLVASGEKVEDEAIELLCDEPKTLDDLKRLSTADLLSRIEEERLPEGVSCWDAYLLKLKPKDTEVVDRAEIISQHCLARQSLQIEQLKSLQLKEKLYAAKKDFDDKYEEVCLEEDCDLILAPYKKIIEELNEQVKPFLFSFAEQDCCFAILNDAIGQEDKVISPFLLKISHLPRARMHIMFCSNLYSRIRHPWVADVALNYFVERHDPEGSPMRVHSEDIAFVVDIFRHTPQLRVNAGMIAKIFTRLGAIKPSFRQALYAGNWQLGYRLFDIKERTERGLVWQERRRIRDLPEVSDGLFQLATTPEELDSLVDDFCRNYLSLTVDGCHFDGAVLNVLRGDSVDSYTGEYLYLRTVQAIVELQYTKVTHSKKSADEFQRWSLTKLEALANFVVHYEGGFASNFEQLFKNDIVCSVGQNILKNKYYEQSDIDSLSRFLDGSGRPIMASFISFIQGAFIKA